MMDVQFFDKTSYFVGYIGCNVPFLNFFSDILELGTNSECYCFVILIIILVSTFCTYYVLLCLKQFAQNFKEISRTYIQVSVSSLKTLSNRNFALSYLVLEAAPLSFAV